MSVVYEIAAVQTIVHALRDAIPPDEWGSTPLPVIAAPRHWLEAVARQMGQEEGMLPTLIHDCPVVQEDSVDGAVMITHDNRVFRLADAVPKLGVDKLAPAEERVVQRLRASAER